MRFKVVSSSAAMFDISRILEVILANEHETNVTCLYSLIIKQTSITYTNIYRRERACTFTVAKFY